MAEMVELTKQRTLVNPGKRRRRRMSMAEKMAFVRRMKRARNKRNAGKFSIRKTKKALKKAYGYKFVSPFGRASGYRKRTRKRNVRRRPKAYTTSRKVRRARTPAQRAYHAKRSYTRAYLTPGRGAHNKGRRQNVSSIMTIYPGLMGGNPGRRRKRRTTKRRRNARKVVIVNMARRRRNRRRYARRRRHNVTYRLRNRRSNPVRHRRRRRHVVRYRRRRRNPFGLGGGGGLFTKVLGVIGGLAITKMLIGFLPANLTAGPLGYITTSAVAVAQGKMIGKFSKSPALGNDLMVGGLALVAAKILNDYFPAIGGYTGISGMGLIGGSSFYVPQVNAAGNMGSFVVPAAVMGAIPAPAANVGATGTLGRLRRTGRLM